MTNSTRTDTTLSDMAFAILLTVPRRRTPIALTPMLVDYAWDELAARETGMWL